MTAFRLTLAQELQQEAGRLQLLARDAMNDRRSHQQTEALLDNIDARSKALHRIARGRG